MQKQILIDIAEEAGKAIMAIRHGTADFKIQSKGDLSPVSAADFQSDLIVNQKLTEFFPDIPIISEEGENREAGDMFFLVDPLDGTKEFIKGDTDFTVNIAFIVNGKPIMGVVHLPAENVTYYGDKQGALVIHDGKEKEISVSGRGVDFRITVSKDHIDDKTQEFLDFYDDIEPIPMGSSKKFCWVADSGAEIYPRLGRTMEWDTAAGQAVLEAAGGLVIDTTTKQPLRYGKPGFENPGFIAVCEDWVSDAVLAEPMFD